MTSTTNILTAAAYAGAKAITAAKQNSLTITHKGDRDFLTSADQASQDAILPILKAGFPGTFILAEEQEQHHIESDTYLAVDPIDGTYNFLHGIPDWGITIGLIKDGYPHAGVILLPDRDILITAERGAGCFLNGTQIKLSSNYPLKDALIGTEVGWFVGEERLRKNLLPLSQKCLGIRCVLGAAASVAEVLQGRTSAYVNLHGAKVWDFAAGVVMVEEAGGYCCATTGERLRWNEVYQNAIFAADRKIAEDVLAAISVK